KIEVPEDIQRKKQVYDSLQNIKLQQEYQARTDSIARASAQQTQENTSGTASDMPSNSSREVVASSAPLDSSLVLGDSVPEEGAIALSKELDSAQNKIKEVLKDTLREKMLSSLSQNKAAA